MKIKGTIEFEFDTADVKKDADVNNSDERKRRFQLIVEAAINGLLMIRDSYADSADTADDDDGGEEAEQPE